MLSVVTMRVRRNVPFFSCHTLKGSDFSVSMSEFRKKKKKSFYCIITVIDLRQRTFVVSSKTYCSDLSNVIIIYLKLIIRLRTPSLISRAVRYFTSGDGHCCSVLKFQNYSLIADNADIRPISLEIT